MLWTPVRLKAAGQLPNVKPRLLTRLRTPRCDSVGYLELEAGAELSGERGGSGS